MLAQDVYFENEHDVPGEAVPDSLTSISDFDGDGVRDFVESARQYNDQRGRAFIRSGATGQAIFTVVGLPSIGFAASSGPLGDVNGDGWEDFGVGAIHDGAGAVYVYSGRSRILLYRIYGFTEEDEFGTSLALAGDLNLDGYDDFFVGAAHGQSPTGRGRTGYVVAVSGLDGTVLYTIEGVDVDQVPTFGRVLDSIADIDRDGRRELVIGDSRFTTGGGTRTGAVHVHSGRTGSLIYRKIGRARGDRLGHSLARIGDIDKDGFDEILAGAPGPLVLNGFVQIISGARGETIARIDGEVGSMLGLDVGSVGDINGDGFDDFLASGSYGQVHGDGVTWLGTHARFYSGRTLEPLYSLREGGGGSENSFDGVGLGDVDGDGLGDWVMGRRSAPSRIVGRRGNDLFLSHSQWEEEGVRHIGFQVRGGTPGALVALALVELNHLLFFQWLSFSKLDSLGSFDLAFNLPPQAVSLEAVFQAYSFDFRGVLLDSGRESTRLDS